MDLTGSKWAAGGRFSSRPAWSLSNKSSSIFASAAPLGAPSSSKLGSQQSTQDGIDQYDKLLRRLEHKARLLLITHQGATSASTAGLVDSDAHTQFKLDFFEFYSLLERALVHLLSIFRISVAAIGVQRNEPLKDASDGKENAPAPKMIIGSHNGPGNHQFHMNVLAALDGPGPLHDVLGVGEVRVCLGTAKDMRNRWKTAADEATRRRVNIPQLNGAWDSTVPDMPALLELERMLNNIYMGLLNARPLAEAETKTGNFHESWRAVKKENGRSMSSTYRQDDEMDCDEPFEVMYDAMELG